MTFPSPSLGIESEMSLDATPFWPSAQLQVKVRGTCTYHVTKCVDKIELLQNIELLWLWLSSETNPLQDLYVSYGRWTAATKCMRDNTKEHIRYLPERTQWRHTSSNERSVPRTQP